MMPQQCLTTGYPELAESVRMLLEFWSTDFESSSQPFHLSQKSWGDSLEAVLTRLCDSELVTNAASRAIGGEAATMGLEWSRGEADGGRFWEAGGSVCVGSTGEGKRTS